MFSGESTDQNRTINHEMRVPCVGWRHMLIAAVDFVTSTQIINGVSEDGETAAPRSDQQ